MEENKYPNVELRSEEVQEVMNRISPWLVRFGILAISVMLLMIVIGGWLFRYPDTLTAEITLTPENPPVFVQAHTTGTIDMLYVKNGSIVTKDCHLGTINNAASTEDVRWLSKEIKGWVHSGLNIENGLKSFTNKQLSLGELQLTFTSFTYSLMEYSHFLKQNYHNDKIDNKKKIQNEIMAYIKQVEQGQMPIEKKSDSCVQDANILKGDVRTNLLQAKIQMYKCAEDILDIQEQANNQKQIYRTQLANATEQLIFQLNNWEKNFLLKSPINGKVLFTTTEELNRYVKAGETVFMILPSDSSKVLGKALLPTKGAGKAHIGQDVHIRLDSYPDQEFGYIPGKIQNILPTTNDKGMYIVVIHLPNGLKTNQGKCLPSSQELKGTADIILANRNVIERLFAPLRNMFD